MPSSFTPDLCEAILTEAHAAAKRAVTGLVENRNALDCGFAWVTIPGTHPLARYCAKRLKADDNPSFYGSKGYPSGWQFWKPGGAPVQSVWIHEVGARAFRHALAQYGISAEVHSRLD